MAKGKSRPITDCGFFHARKRPVSAENLAEQHSLLRSGAINVGVGIVGIRQRGLDRYNAARIEAERHPEQVPEAAQQKACGDH